MRNSHNGVMLQLITLREESLSEWKTALEIGNALKIGLEIGLGLEIGWIVHQSLFLRPSRDYHQSSL